jgi:RND family efflux transporter MFP subunit
MLPSAEFHEDGQIDRVRAAQDERKSRKPSMLNGSFCFLTPCAGILFLAIGLSSCNRPSVSAKTNDDESIVTVGTAVASTRPMAQHLTLSSELVPYQEIDVYAKVAGYVKELNVDYGSHVAKGQVMAVLEVPELQAQLDEDDAAIRAQTDQVARLQSEIGRAKAQHNMLHLQYDRLAGVAKAQAGLVAQQEVDDAHGKDLAAESQVEAAQGAYQAAQGQLMAAKAKLGHDQAFYDYSKITAPFDGVVTQRYANFGALMQAGTTSTQATPLVRLSDENLYRLVIPVPESDVKYIHLGDPVEVRVPSVDKTVKGTVKRFSVDVNGATRTMHTEVEIPNANSGLVPGVYAEAVVTLNHNATAIVVPVHALDHQGDQASLMAVGPDNRIEIRNVTLGIQMPDFVEIASGISPGEQVVVTDRSGLRTGQVVKPKPLESVSYEGNTQQ